MEELDKKYRENGFKTPESYFDHFDDKVFERLKDSKKPAPATLSFWKRKTTWMAAASITLIGAVAYITTQKSTVPVENAYSFEQVDPAELSQYENEVELSEDEFEEIMPAYTIDSLYQAEILQVNNTHFSPDELEDLEEEYSALDENI